MNVAPEAGGSGYREPWKEASVKNGKFATLNLEVEEIERRERDGGTCSSSTTSNHCTCMCIPNTTIQCDP